jgi:hypothetical protein
MEGCKGERIFLSSSYNEIVQFLMEEAMHAAYGEVIASAWVVQRYIHNPLLLRGGRKFDLRCWVLLDADYNVWLYQQVRNMRTVSLFGLSDILCVP